MNLSRKLLFSNNRLFDVFQGQLKTIQKEVDNISKEKFLKNSDDEIKDYILERMKIEPLEIHENKTERSDSSESRMDRKNPFGDIIHAPSVQLTISIPFTGNPELWDYQPSSFGFSPPKGDVSVSTSDELQGVLNIQLAYFQSEFHGDSVNKEIKAELASINSYISSQKRDIQKHKKELIIQIHNRVLSRRKRLNAILEEGKTIQIPLKKKENTPDQTILPIHRRKIPVLKEKTESTETFSISDADYEEVLNLIRHQGATYERTPKTYYVHDEEELRDILLGQLNGQYQGQATGETFRNKGKTDICIEAENRAAFVAECKVWVGGKKVLDSLDQLLDYLTWRDVKTALIIFNKNVAGFSGIQIKTSEILKSHENFISLDPENGGVEWRLRLKSKNDPERYVAVCVFLFNLYSQEPEILK